MKGRKKRKKRRERSGNHRNNDTRILAIFEMHASCARCVLLCHRVCVCVCVYDWNVTARSSPEQTRSEMIFIARLAVRYLRWLYPRLMFSLWSAGSMAELYLYSWHTTTTRAHVRARLAAPFARSLARIFHPRLQNRDRRRIVIIDGTRAASSPLSPRERDARYVCIYAFKRLFLPAEPRKQENDKNARRSERARLETTRILSAGSRMGVRAHAEGSRLRKQTARMMMISGARNRVSVIRTT